MEDNQKTDELKQPESVGQRCSGGVITALGEPGVIG